MSGEKVTLSNEVQSTDQSQEVAVDEKWMQTLLQVNDMRVTSLQEQLAKKNHEIARLGKKCLQFEEKSAQLKKKQILLQQKCVKLESIVNVDSLTQILNRNFLETSALKLIANEQRNKRSWGLFMIDIDFFKKFNDVHGHLFGDLVLQNVAQKLAKMSREGDFAIRYGGEEFTILVFNINKEDNLIKMAERYRQSIEKVFTEKEGIRLNVTVSIGVCFVPGDSSMRLNSVIEYADTALFEAKKWGRNCVMVSDRRRTMRHDEK